MSFFKISEHCLVLIKFLTFSIYRHFLHQFPNPRPLQGSIENIKHLCGQTVSISSTEHRLPETTLLGHQDRISYISYNIFLLYGVCRSRKTWWRWWSSHHGWLAWFWRGHSRGLPTALVILDQLNIRIEEEGKSLVKFSVWRVGRYEIGNGPACLLLQMSLSSARAWPWLQSCSFPNITICFQNKWIIVSSLCHITSQHPVHSFSSPPQP